MNVGQRFAVWLSRVTAVAVGKDNDGLSRVIHSESEIDKPWGMLAQEITDARDAWRNNPLARRLVGLQVGYVVSDGLGLSSSYAPLKKYLRDWTDHPQNNLRLRQAALYEELVRAGELFVTLHTNRADGIAYVRAIPASRIDIITHQPGDYEAELTYHEVVPIDDPDYDKGGRIWLNPAHPDAHKKDGDNIPPVMLHYAINRPVGALRGESDLTNILPWLRRYNRWLEDRVRLNAAMRAFLWLVKVPGRLMAAKAEQYRQPPEPGTVIIAEQGAEEWQALNPAVNAGDASLDGRAIKYMVLAGSTGFALTDLGQGEDANLATAKAMGEQKVRWLGQRQAYFGYILRDLALVSFNRAVKLGLVRGRAQQLTAITVATPDLNPSDNAELAQAHKTLAEGLEKTAGIAGLAGPTWQRTVIRLAFQYLGQELSDSDLDAMLEESAEAAAAAQAAAQGGLPANPDGSVPQTDTAGADWWSGGGAATTTAAPGDTANATATAPAAGAPASNTTMPPGSNL